MNWQHGLLMGVSLAAAVTAWAAVFLLFPRIALSLFRYRLWQVRDALVDDVIDGRVRQSAAVDHLQDLIEGAIIRAPELTLTDMMVWRWSVGAELPARKTIVDQLATIPGEQGERLRTHLTCFLEATGRHLQHGTPVGWFFSVSLPVLYKIHAARHQRPNRSASAEGIVKRNVLIELESMSMSNSDERLLASV